MCIHHLNCGTLLPSTVSLKGIIYCLLIESSDGLVLVDTGLGLDDCARPTRLMRMFAAAVGAALDAEEAAVRQVERLGYDPGDVRHIVLTHLHLDHTGGLPDFPHAQVHVSATEFATLERPRGLIERGHVPRHWAHGPEWVLYEPGGEDWYGFGAATVAPGLGPRILLVALPGHTRGHCGVAIETPRGWLLQCGDAASPFHPSTDLHPGPDRSYPLKRLGIPDGITRRLIGPHVPRLRELGERLGPGLELISAHDTFGFMKHRHGT